MHPFKRGIDTHFNCRSIFGTLLVLLLSACVESPSDIGCEQVPFELLPEYCPFYLDNQLVLGEPISTYRFDTDEDSGEIFAYQYFEGMRLELRSIDGEEKIVSAPVGIALFDEEPAYESQLEAEFVDVYRRYGAEILGQPISDARIEDGRLVQYFENTRLRYDRSLSIVVNDTLGLAHLQRNHPELIQDGRHQFGSLPLLQIDAHLGEPVLNVDEVQSIYLSLASNETPLAGARINMKVISPNGTSAERDAVDIGLTNEDGILAVPLPQVGANPGEMTEIEIGINHSSIGQTSIFLSYVGWW